MIEDKFVTNFPANQNGIDCLPGIWYSRFPDSYEVQAGDCSLYEDKRLEWALGKMRPENMWDVLELGPLEAGHTYYMERHTPVRSITAIEANRLCWVKCLIAKEITDLKRSRFLLGDFIQYLNTSKREYDLCLALGVLYHMKDPLELLRLIAQASPRVILWTQLAGEVQRKDWHPIEVEDGDFKASGYVNDYGLGIQLGKFIGGIDNYAVWLTRESLVQSLGHYGFNSITYGPEGENQFGKEITLVAEKI
jgi:hypothetical protein